DEPYTVELAADHASLDQRRRIDNALHIQLAAVDVALDAVEADGIPLLGAVRVEAALGHAHVDRHLAALEAVDGNAGARGLALAAAAARLALARADTTPNADAGLVGARIVAKFVQTRHFPKSFSLFAPCPVAAYASPGRPLDYFASTTRTRCGSLLIMPRTSGVSLSVERLRILLSPRPIRVARWSAVRRMGEPICSMVMVLSAICFFLRLYQASAAAASPRRACSSDTLRPRRAATERGLSTRFSASKVARTML